MLPSVFLPKLKAFFHDESGIVTTDFLVLTAIVVGMSLISLNAISAGTQIAASKVASGINLMDDEL